MSIEEITTISLRKLRDQKVDQIKTLQQEILAINTVLGLYGASPPKERLSPPEGEPFSVETSRLTSTEAIRMIINQAPKRFWKATYIGRELDEMRAQGKVAVREERRTAEIVQSVLRTLRRQKFIERGTHPEHGVLYETIEKQEDQEREVENKTAPTSDE